MSVPKLPLDPRWLEQELVPFLRYAFSNTLPHDADLTPKIQEAVDFCMTKLDHLSDGNDVLFEQIFMAIMHRHKKLAPEFSLVTMNLEPLAKYMIRRAQLKGPFELLGRSYVASATWVELEKTRLVRLLKRGQWAREGPHSLIRPVVGPSLEPKAAPTEDVIDPRLWNAQPGQCTMPGLSLMMTPAEDEHYRRRNQILREADLRRLAGLSQEQQPYTAVGETQDLMPGRGAIYGQNMVQALTNQQQQGAAYTQNHRQLAVPQTRSNYYAANRGGNFPGYAPQAVPDQASQQIPTSSNPTNVKPSVQASHSYPAQPNKNKYRTLLPKQQLPPNSSLQPNPTAELYQNTSFLSPRTCTSNKKFTRPTQNAAHPSTSPSNPRRLSSAEHHLHALTNEMVHKRLLAENKLRLQQNHTLGINPTTAATAAATTTFPTANSLANNNYVSQFVGPSQPGFLLSSTAGLGVGGGDMRGGQQSVVGHGAGTFDVHPQFSNIVSPFPVVGSGGEGKK